MVDQSQRADVLVTEVDEPVWMRIQSLVRDECMEKPESDTC